MLDMHRQSSILHSFENMDGFDVEYRARHMFQKQPKQNIRNNQDRNHAKNIQSVCYKNVSNIKSYVIISFI